MASRYRLSFSPIDASVNVAEIQDRAVLKEKMSKRNLEKIILSNLISLAANSAKSLSDVNVCGDLLGQIENLADDKTELIVDDADKKNIMTGFEASVGKRPFAWFLCRELWKQLDALPKVEEK